MALIPLYMLQDGAKFRIEGRRRIFTKKNNLATILTPDPKYYTGEATCTHISEAACYCKTSSGRIFVKKWFDFVEEI